MTHAEIMELIEHGEDPKVDPQIEQEIRMELGGIPLPEFMSTYLSERQK